MQASGEFDVKLQPLEASTQGSDGVNLGRMSIEKTYSGDLSAVSRGEMLNVLTMVEGSAGYVAIEQVIGILSGKSGSFVLQHFGTMCQGDNFLLLEVIPNSGTRELTGISGKMAIRMADGQHFYDFDYELAE